MADVRPMNRYMNELTTHWLQYCQDGDLSHLDQGRTAIQYLLNAKSANLFPMDGIHGTSVVEVMETILTATMYQITRVNRCSYCNTDNILTYLNRGI